MVERQAYSGVNLILERIPEIRVLEQSLGETSADVIKLYEVYLERIQLIEYLVAFLPRVSE